MATIANTCTVRAMLCIIFAVCSFISSVSCFSSIILIAPYLLLFKSLNRLYRRIGAASDCVQRRADLLVNRSLYPLSKEVKLLVWDDCIIRWCARFHCVKLMFKCATRCAVVSPLFLVGLLYTSDAADE